MEKLGSLGASEFYFCGSRSSSSKYDIKTLKNRKSYPVVFGGGAAPAAEGVGSQTGYYLWFNES
jgi:hypothetical protein